MLAIIAGQGALPAALVERLSQRPLILSLDGFQPDGVEVDRVFRLEKLGTVLKQLRRDGVPAHPYLWAGFVTAGDWR